jgi:hypothetical protein
MPCSPSPSLRWKFDSKTEAAYLESLEVLDTQAQNLDGEIKDTETFTKILTTGSKEHGPT